MRISIFWDVMTCSLIRKYRSFTCYSEFPALLYQIPRRRTPEDGCVSLSHRENLDFSLQVGFSEHEFKALLMPLLLLNV